MMITWKRIGLNNYSFPEIKEYKNKYITHSHMPDKLVLTENTDQRKRELEGMFDCDDSQGLGENIISHVVDSFNSGIFVEIPGGTKINENIEIRFEMDKENPTLVDYNLIKAEANSQVTIIFDYESTDDSPHFHNGLTRVHAAAGSVVNIIKIQRMNDKSYSFDSNVAIVEGDGEVNWISAEIGSHVSAANYASLLEGMASQSNLHSIYIGDGERKMDLEYNMIHKAPRSVSYIETKGVLKDKTTKVFRGNLDFRRGSKHAKGVEEEFVILLDPTVKSDSIPALLAKEDDVEGDHAVTAGQLDESKLFYLMSRGLDEQAAKKLIVESSFRPIIEKIPSTSLRQLVTEEVERRLING